MSSRQEEKERRRKEREEAERKAAAGAARSRRLQMVGGIVLGVAVVAVAAVLLSGGGSSGSGSGPSTTAGADVTLAPRKITNLEDAAKAGGCTVRTFPMEGRTHVTTKVTYKTNPPTSGDHNVIPAEDGIYGPGNTPTKEHYVHSLEHGRIELQYQPGASQRTIDTLTALFNEPVHGSPGYHTLLFENNTGMKSPIAATAWTHMITCDDLNPQAIDALRAFRERWTDKGPEFVG